MKNQTISNRNSHWLRHLVCSVLALAPILGLAEPPHITYVLRPGESLDMISRQYLNPGYSWRDLAKNNALTDPGLIQIGHRLRIPVAWLAAKPAAAKLMQLSGDVQVADPTTDWQAAQQGALVHTGNRIKLGRNSSAILRFADGSELALQPDTELALDTVSIYVGGHMSDTRLRLQSGRVEVRANPKGLPYQKLNVITPSAITAVRGTQFMVEAQADQSLTQTNEGLVELLNPQGSVMVSAGYSSQVKTGQAPLPPIATPPAPMLLQASSRFTDFPIQFTAAPQDGATSWITQNGPGDGSQMLAISKQIKTVTPDFELGLLDNGTYQLRTWYIDAQGMPSKITQHAFEVRIPRKLQNPAIAIQANWLATNLQFELPPLPDRQRYLLQLTQDAQGLQTVWYTLNAATNAILPKQPQPQTSPYHLWIWAY